jgi:tRNA threonylcarbamoyladenosine biosynthesis protein TsaB
MRERASGDSALKILALDTATENCSAALLIDASLNAREVEIERGHAERILPMIDELLSQAHVTLTELDAIAFGRGPGSFTGVRLAATVTQGLAFGASRGVAPISDLQAVAQRAFSMDVTLTRVLVCNDARMREVYWACYERGDDGRARLEGEERVSKPDEVRLPTAWPNATAVGRGFAAYEGILRTTLPAVPLPSPFAVLLPRASEIAVLAVPAVLTGQLVPPEAAIPIYLRDNVAHVAPSAKGPE